MLRAINPCCAIRQQSVDGDVDTCLHPLVALPCAPAAHQFDLQMVQRVDVRETVLMDRARAALCARRCLSPVMRVSASAVRCHSASMAVNTFCAGGRRSPTRCSGMPEPDRLGQHHVHVGQQRAEERPLPVHALQQGQLVLGSLPRHSQRLRRQNQSQTTRQRKTALAPAEAPRNGTQSSIFWLALRDAGRDPIFSSAISRMGVELKK